MKPYPIILNLTAKKIAVVGGGKVARRKIKKLNEAGVVPTVISPVLNDRIARDQVEWIEDVYHRDYVKDMDIIIACTDDAAVNERVKREATHFQLVNNTSNKGDSDFYNLATLRSDDLLISVSTLGKSPSAAKKVKNELKNWFKVDCKI